MANPIFVIDIDENGIVATHPRRLELPVLVAPIPEEQKAKNLNTIRPQLVAIACFALPGTRFAFDSSLIAPEGEPGFTRFARLMLAMRAQDDAQPKRFPPLAVFGHADPTGGDEYNKTLSGRRALAVYAVLVRKVEIWEQLFSAGFGGDQWGMKSIQTMLSTSLGPPDAAPEEPAFYLGPIDGKKSKETTDAISAYLGSRGFKPTDTLDRPADAKRRARLFADYMNAICHAPDGKPFVLDAVTDFVARRKDPNLKGDVQGCGEFNPKFRISKRLEDDAKKSKVFEVVRNEANQVNRRVVVYAFRQGSEIDPTRWPCPHARDGPAACRLRFWSDEPKRRAAAEDDRTFGEKMTILAVDASGEVRPVKVEETGNTMGCRFYHAFAVNSPCEAKVREWVVRFRIDASGGKQLALANRRYVVKAGEAEFSPVIRGTTTDKGEIRIPVFGEQTKMTVRLDAFGAPAKLDDPGGTKPAPQPAGGAAQAPPGFDTDRFPDEDAFLAIVLDAGALKERDVGDDLAIRQRLYNLGFGERPPAEWKSDEFRRAMEGFRRRHPELEKASDATVRARVLEEHELTDPDPPVPAD